MSKRQISANTLAAACARLEGRNARFLVQRMTSLQDVQEVLGRFMPDKLALVTAVVDGPGMDAGAPSQAGAQPVVFSSPMQGQETVVALMIAPTELELD